MLPAFIAVLVWNMRRPPAISLAVQGDDLVVRLMGWDALYCCRRRVITPLDAVAGVCVARRQDLPAQGFRLPGTGIPGLIRAGSYGAGGERDFWNVRKADRVLVVEMKPGATEYRRIILQVPDPHSEMLRLRPTLGSVVLPLPHAV